MQSCFLAHVYRTAPSTSLSIRYLYNSYWPQLGTIIAPLTIIIIIDNCPFLLSCWIIAFYITAHVAASSKKYSECSNQIWPFKCTLKGVNAEWSHWLDVMWSECEYSTNCQPWRHEELTRMKVMWTDGNGRHAWDWGQEYDAEKWRKQHNILWLILCTLRQNLPPNANLHTNLRAAFFACTSLNQRRPLCSATKTEPSM